MLEGKSSFDEFWPHFVRQHKSPTNRALHVVGAALGLLIAAAAIRRKRPLLLLAAPAVAYGVAWCGHLMFEKNLPTSFAHPIDSVAGNFVMFAKMITGDMAGEVLREAGEPARAAEPPADRTDLN